MSTYESKYKAGHPVAGIVLAVLGIGIAVLLTLLFGESYTAAHTVVSL